MSRKFSRRSSHSQHSGDDWLFASIIIIIKNEAIIIGIANIPLKSCNHKPYPAKDNVHGIARPNINQDIFVIHSSHPLWGEG